MNKKSIIVLSVIGIAFVLGVMYVIKNTFQSMNTEVIDAFEIMNEKLDESNASTTEKNYRLQKALLENLDASTKLKVHQVDSISNTLFDVIETLKTELLSSVSDASNYEAMDNTSQLLFENNFEKGKLLVNAINNYRLDLTELLSTDFPEITSDINERFDTKSVGNKEGKDMDWLIYNFYEFPVVAVLTKLTQIQVDVESSKSHIFNAIANLN